MRAVLVDDERLLLKDLEQILSGYEDVVIEKQFTDPVAALEYIVLTKPEVAFLDVNMPQLNGVDLAERILEQLPEIEVVFITAYDEYAIKAFEINAFDYLLKPVDEERIEKTIVKLRKLLASREPIREPSALHIKYFGRFDLLVNGNPVRWRSRKAQEFVAFLLARENKAAQKYVICDALYPDMDEKSAVLNVQSTASRARQSLVDSGCGARITYNNDGYQIVMPEHRTDLQQMDELLKNTTSNAPKIKELYKDGYMSENGWLWSYSAAAIWDEQLADFIEEL